MRFIGLVIFVVVTLLSTTQSFTIICDNAIVTCELECMKEDSKKMEGGQSIVRKAKVSKIDMNSANETTFVFQKFETVVVKIAKNDESSKKAITNELQAYRFIKTSGPAICGIPRVEVGWSTDLHSDANWEQKDDEDQFLYTIIVMELLEKNLFQYRGNIFEDSKVVAKADLFFGQVDGTLESLHRIGLIHGDVKPDNILIKGDQAYLTDFGLAVFESKDYKSHVDGPAGTYAFMSWRMKHENIVDGINTRAATAGDDKESSVWSRLEFLLLNLPWYGEATVLGGCEEPTALKGMQLKKLYWDFRYVNGDKFELSKDIKMQLQQKLEDARKDDKHVVEMEKVVRKSEWENLKASNAVALKSRKRWTVAH